LTLRGGVMTPTAYENDSSRLLSNFVQKGDTIAAAAAKWFDQRAAAEANLATAEAAFVASFAPQDAGALVEAQTRLNDLSVCAAAVLTAGGPEQARADFLRTPAVFAAFAAGFAERSKVLEKLTPVARKKLGERRALLSEQGVIAPLIEVDPIVSAWRQHAESITAALAVAVFGNKYASLRGVGYASNPKPFSDLYSTLTAPLPQAPTVA